MKYEKLIKYVDTLESGARPKGGASEFSDESIPSLGAEHLNDDGGFKFDKIKYIPESFYNQMDSGLIKTNDILIVKDGATTGKISHVNKSFPFQKAAINEHVFLLRLNEEKAYPSFIFHYLKTETGQKEIMKDFRGATVGGISRRFMELVNVPVVSLQDQIRIADILSRTESLIAKRKESIRLLDDLVKSVFLDMFGDPVRNEKGWDTFKGDHYSALLTVGVVVKPASYYTENGVIALRSLNIKPNYIDLNNLVYFSEEASNGVLGKSVLHEGDVVVVRTGVTGTAAVIPKELDGVNCIDLIIVRPKKNILNPQYLAFLLNSDRGKTLVASREVGGIQKHFNIGAIKDIPFPLPPVELQNNFASVVEKVEATKVKYRESLSELEALYCSLSQRAFRGELNYNISNVVNN